MFWTIKLKKLILSVISLIAAIVILTLAFHSFSKQKIIQSVCEEMELSDSLENSALYVNSETAPVENSENAEGSENPEQTENTAESENSEKKDYIKWVDFDICCEAMDKAFKLDVESQSSDIKINWIEILAYLGTKYGGDFSKYKAKDIDAVCEKLKSGTPMSEIMKDNKY